jgi:hypothetical protein
LQFVYHELAYESPAINTVFQQHAKGNTNAR